MRQMKNRYLKEKREKVKGSIRGMNFDLNKSKFRDAVKLRYDWEVPDTSYLYVYFNVDSHYDTQTGGFVTQRHSELEDLEAELLNMVCKDIEVEQVWQDITGEELIK